MIEISGVNIPYVFVGPIALVIILELISGISLGASWYRRRNENAFGFWFNISIHTFILCMIILLYNDHIVRFLTNETGK
jgi:uncharacterized membrane protein